MLFHVFAVQMFWLTASAS